MADNEQKEKPLLRFQLVSELPPEVQKKALKKATEKFKKPLTSEQAGFFVDADGATDGVLHDVSEGNKFISGSPVGLPRTLLTQAGAALAPTAVGTLLGAFASAAASPWVGVPVGVLGALGTGVGQEKILESMAAPGNLAEGIAQDLAMQRKVNPKMSAAGSALAGFSVGGPIAKEGLRRLASKALQKPLAEVTTAEMVKQAAPAVALGAGVNTGIEAAFGSRDPESLATAALIGGASGVAQANPIGLGKVLGNIGAQAGAKVRRAAGGAEHSAHDVVYSDTPAPQRTPVQDLPAEARAALALLDENSATAQTVKDTIVQVAPEALWAPGDEATLAKDYITAAKAQQKALATLDPAVRAEEAGKAYDLLQAGGEKALDVYPAWIQDIRNTHNKVGGLKREEWQKLATAKRQDQAIMEMGPQLQERFAKARAAVPTEETTVGNPKLAEDLGQLLLKDVQKEQAAGGREANKQARALAKQLNMEDKLDAIEQAAASKQLHTKLNKQLEIVLARDRARKQAIIDAKLDEANAIRATADAEAKVAAELEALRTEYEGKAPLPPMDPRDTGAVTMTGQRYRPDIAPDVTSVRSDMPTTAQPDLPGVGLPGVLRRPGAVPLGINPSEAVDAPTTVKRPTGKIVELAPGETLFAPPVIKAGGPLTGTPVPEAQDQIAEQLKLVKDPQSTKSVALITPGTELPKLPKGLKSVVVPQHGTVIYNPKKITPEAVAQAGAGPIFDPAPLGLGRTPVAASDMAVTTATPEGTPVLSALATPDTVADTVAAQQAATKGKGLTTVEPAVNELVKRVEGNDEQMKLWREMGDVASAQRGQAEMLGVMADPEFKPLIELARPVQQIFEHTGDLINRLGAHDGPQALKGMIANGPADYGREAALNKISKVLRWLGDVDPGVNTTLRPYVERTLAYAQTPEGAWMQSPELPKTAAEAMQKLKAWQRAYAAEHAKLKPATRTQELAQRAAISLGLDDLKSAKASLLELRQMLQGDNWREAYYAPPAAAKPREPLYSGVPPVLAKRAARAGVRFIDKYVMEPIEELVEKIAKLGPKGQLIAEAERGRSRWTSAAQNEDLNLIHKARKILHESEATNVNNYLSEMDDFGVSSIRLTPREQYAVDMIRSVLLQQVARQESIGAKVTEGGRFIEPKPDYVPWTPLKHVWQVLQKGSRNHADVALRNEFTKLRQHYVDYIVGKHGLSFAEAENMFDTGLLNVYRNGDALTDAQFKAVRQAEGYGIPREWRDSVWTSMDRHAKRFNLDLGYWKYIQSDPEIARYIGIEDDGIGNVYPPPAEGEETLRGNAAIKSWLSSLTAYRNYQTTPLLDSMGLVGSFMMGTVSGIRDFIYTPAITLSMADSIPMGVASVVNGAFNMLSQSARRSGAASAQNLLMVENLVHSATDTAVRNLRGATSKWSGRQMFDARARQWAYSAGQSMNEMMKKRPGYREWLERMGPEKGWREALATGDEKFISEMVGARFVDLVQGNYDATSLPQWLLPDGAGDKQLMLAAFGLARWSVSRANAFRRMVWEPAKKGNFGPLVSTMFATYLANDALEPFMEEITGYAKAFWRPSELGKVMDDELMYTVLSNIHDAQMLGILTWPAKAVAQLANDGRVDVPWVNLGYEAGELIAGHMRHFASMMQNQGAQDPKAVAQAIYDTALGIATDATQTGRMLKKWMSDKPPTHSREEIIWRRQIGRPLSAADRVQNRVSPLAKFGDAVTLEEATALYPAIKQELSWTSTAKPELRNPMRSTEAWAVGEPIPFYDWLERNNLPAAEVKAQDQIAKDLRDKKQQLIEQAYKEVLQERDARSGRLVPGQDPRVAVGVGP